MAAASNKPGAIVYAFVFSILLNLVFGVMAYLFNKQISEKNAQWEADKTKEKASTAALTKAVQDREILNRFIGHSFQIVGGQDEQLPNTMVASMRSDIALAGGGAPSMSVALRNLARDNQQLRNDLAKTTANLQTAETKIQGLQAEYQLRVDDNVRAKQTAETDLASRTREFTENRDKLMKDIEDQRVALQNMRHELDDAIANHEKYVKEQEGQVRNLKLTVKRWREEVDRMQNISFDQELGRIVNVDSTTGLVWIDLGEEDKLPLRLSMSVYKKAHGGVGRRGNSDLKGKIEITRILDAHMAEARIIDSINSDPITVGDPIYTPAWYPGRELRFSLVGWIDLDGDGRSDRQMLRELIEGAGGKIDNEVDDDGNLTGNGVTVDTKFLIVGKIPELEDAKSKEDEAKIANIAKQYQVLNTKALEQGVRIVSLYDFANWIGYKPKNRLYRPGEARANTLKAGAKSGGLGQRTQGATKAELYKGSSKAKPKAAPVDDASKLFGRGGR